MLKTRIPSVVTTRTLGRALCFDGDMYSTPRQKTMNDLLDEHRLKQHLRRTVMKDHAPQSLLDSIRNGIRA